MYKKYASVLVGAILIATPFIASAQTTSASSNAALIAQLTALLQVLEQELQQLLAARGSSSVTPTGSPTQQQPTFTAKPTTGPAPLTVSFYMNDGDTIDFGDGTNGCSVSTDTQNCFIPQTFTHTYTTPGTYQVQVGMLTPARITGTATITVTGSNSTQPSVTINQSSLTTSSANPIITGTYASSPGIEVIVTNTALPPSGLMSAMTSQSLWRDSSDHGGGVMLSGSTSGTWSDTITTPLPQGIYSVGVYQDTLYYPQIDVNLAKDTRTLLTSGTLTITGNSTQSSATITSPSVQYSGNFSVSGTFANTNASSAIVVLVSQPYTGASNWNTVGGYLQGNTYATTPSGNRLYSYSTAVTGANHQFSVGFSNVPAGSYSVFVYTGTYGSQTFLAQGTVTVQ